MPNQDKASSREQQAIEAVKAVTPDTRKFKVTGTVDNVLDGTFLQKHPWELTDVAAQTLTVG